MKIFKYLSIGIVASLVDILLFSLFAKFLGFNYLIVGFFSFIIATGVNYILSIHYVFESGIKHSKKKEIILVYIISAIGLLINLSMLYLFIDFLNFEMIFSKILSAGIVFFWNYFARSVYVF